MNPQDLIAPSSPLGNPAPFWFITFFKVLGFILHMIPMNIWYAGMLLIAIFATFGKNHSEQLAHRLSRSMPIIVAMGINLGIVPLLFTQVGYPQFYYPAGDLIGWPWLSVIFFLIFAYYGVYVYSLSVRNIKKTKFAIASAWVSSILFIIIGFLFANNFSLMVNVDEWVKIFNTTNVAGAVTGRALNISDPTLFPRWLMMFGIAMMTTAIYILIDASQFKKSSTTQQYKVWAMKFAFILFSLVPPEGRVRRGHETGTLALRLRGLAHRRPGHLRPAGCGIKDQGPPGPARHPLQDRLGQGLHDSQMPVP